MLSFPVFTGGKGGKLECHGRHVRKTRSVGGSGQAEATSDRKKRNLFSKEVWGDLGGILALWGHLEENV